jgi:hypothetical protein
VTPFSPTGPEIPPAPLDVPTPSIPAADFRKIGAEFAKGAADVAASASKVPAWLSWIADLVTQILVALLSVWEWIVAKLLAIFLKILSAGSSESEAITDIVLGGLLNGKHDARTFSLVTAVLNTLGAGSTGGGSGSIQPSTQGAENFLRLSSRLAIESWVWGVVAEESSIGLLKDIGGLKDALESGLGLGRLARRALAPPMKILVADPFTWALNQLYRPTVMKEGQAVREFVRGNIDRATLDKYLGYAGVPLSDVDALINFDRPHLGVAQLIELVNIGYLDSTTAQQELQNAGWDAITAGWLLKAEMASQEHILAREYIAAAEAGYVRLKIDVATFESVVDQSVLPVLEKEYIKTTASIKRAGSMQLPSLGQALQLFELGTISLDEYRRVLVLHGITDGEATVDQWNANVDAAIGESGGTPWVDWLELLAIHKSSDAATAAAAKANAAKAKADSAQARAITAAAKLAAAKAAVEAHGLSIAKYETLVKDGVKTIAQYEAFLALKGIAPDNITALSTVLQAAIAKAAAAAAAKAGGTASPKAKVLSLAELEAGVKGGYTTLAEFEADLVTRGYTAADAALLSELLADGIAAAKLKADTRAAVKAALAIKHVNLAEEEKAVRLGLNTVADFQAFLASHGFAQEDIDILTGELNALLAADKAAAAKKASAASLGGMKHIALASLERAVRAGVSSTAEYAAALSSAGYDSTSQAELMGLLQLQLENDQHLEAATGKASALLGQRGVSLGDLKSAVKLGVVDISVYDAALARAGVSSSDAAILHASLVAEIASKSKTTAKKPTIAATLTAQGLSLSSLETAVVDGKLTMAEFQQTALAAGVTAADLAPIVALLGEELANKAAAAALQLSAAQRAAARGLSLSQEQSAVVEGVKTIDDYRAFVTALGYDVADVATLTATLAAKLAAKAAKGPKPAPPPAVP